MEVGTSAGPTAGPEEGTGSRLLGLGPDKVETTVGPEGISDGTSLATLGPAGAALAMIGPATLGPVGVVPTRVGPASFGPTTGPGGDVPLPTKGTDSG